MGLLRQVRRPPDEVVFPFVYFRDKSRSFGIGFDLHPVSYGYGVRASYVAQAEVAFDFTFDLPPVVRPDGVPAAGIFDDQPLHTVMISFSLAA
jgi:hypothetical protein